MTASAPAPDIFSFTDYREYLLRFYEHRKAENPRFSHRKIHEWVGASSSGWFADLVKGRINLTGTYLVRLIARMGFRPNEADFFETLVRYDQAGSMDEKNRYWEKIISFKEIRADLVGKDKFEYYAHWYHAAIRELLFVYDFKGDYVALARKLNPPIRSSEARKAIELLLRLDFVRQEGPGPYRPTSTVLLKDKDSKSPHLENFLRSNIELGVKALERLPKEERDISALTMVLSEEKFAAAKAEVKALRKRLLALSEKNKSGGKVFQCNFQLFPVSK